MPFSASDYQNLLITNLILSLILISIVLAVTAFVIFGKIQSVRRELKADYGRVFPVGDAEKVVADLEKAAQLPPIQQISPPLLRPAESENVFISLTSSTPSSLLTKSFTSSDFASKTLLDKKCFALAYGGQKHSSGGLKDLIPL